MDTQKIALALEQSPARLSSSPFPTASVAIIFSPEMKVLMFKRAKRRSDPWSGHIAFPGGKIDRGDPNPKAAAERETAEEVGLHLTAEDVTFFGRLDDQQTPWLTISAFVYGLPNQPKTTINEEVERPFWLPFEDLCKAENRTTLNFKRGKIKGRYSAVRVNNQTIWGISLRFIDELRMKLQ